LTVPVYFQAYANVPWLLVTAVGVLCVTESNKPDESRSDCLKNVRLAFCLSFSTKKKRKKKEKVQDESKRRTNSNDK
jgi:hypothetical protein